MDITHYRRSEALAQQIMPSWRHAQAHRPRMLLALSRGCRSNTADELAGRAAEVLRGSPGPS